MMFRCLVALLCAASLPAADAIYPSLQPDAFLRSWLVLKAIPVPHGDADQRKVFAGDEVNPQAQSRPQPGAKVIIGGREFEWKRVDSAKDTVDLNDPPTSYAFAYAWADFEMPEATKAILGVGSDDFVKVWLNGTLIHENFAARAASPDDDPIPVEFRRGRNQLLIKVLNLEGDWGFACRIMGPQSRVNRLVSEAKDSGDVDAVKRLLDTGLIAINGRDQSGLTAVQAARIKGNAELASYLISHGADSQPLPPPEKLIDTQFSNLVHPNDPGVAVLLSQDGKIIFEKGYGLADLEHKIPVTPKTRFRIGSITKQFTASAILKLQEEGKLSVTDKLSKYLPDFPRASEVTLVDLLHHTSGIHSYTENATFLAAVTKPITLVDLIQIIQKDPYDFDPGKKWSYDNSGYTLLAYVIRKVTGETFADYLQKTFFVPLGMNDTRVHLAYAQLSNEALGYKYEGSHKFSRAVDWNLSRVTGAGDMDSTVEDLFRWNEALFNGKVLSEASLKAAFTPISMSDPSEKNPAVGYGFGWGIVELRGSPEISHNGGLPGYSSHLTRLPREKVTIVTLANTAPGGPGVEPSSLGQLAVEMYLGDKLAPRTINKANPNVSSKAFDAITGLYDYGKAVMRVTAEAGHAYAQLSGQPRFEIFPKSETEYFWKVVDAHVTFLKDDSGKVVKAVHYQGGSIINAPRIELPSVDTASLEAIVGKYDYGQGKAILTVTREGDQVYAQLTNQPKFDIYPKSPTDYYWKIVDAQVTFVKDSSGKVTKAIHHQNGGSLEAPKIE